MSLLDQPWFSKINRPSRYLGNEVNAIKKAPGSTEVSVALAFPDVYEVGMSHLGLKILYHILNRREWLCAERIFSPWVDLERELRRRNIPPTTLESGRPLSSFDMVGFSLQHELSYTNVLNLLDLSCIPFLASERGDSSPFIIAGGPACFNPEPVAEFFDLIVVGDGEEVLLQICKIIRKAGQTGTKSKKELFSQLRHIKGVYIPAYFRPHYTPGGIFECIEPMNSDHQFVEKAIVPDIDAHPFPQRQVVPFTELIHDRMAIEISRGCTRGCRFCQAGMIYRPVRERSPNSILAKAEKAMKLTGHEDLSLLSLSTGDYGCVGLLLKALMDKQAREKISISLPSLRIDSLHPSLMEQIKRVRKTGFTLAPEAGNDRLRKIINKRLTQEDIVETARMVYDAGWNLIKLYFMVGLPFEQDEDLEDIIRLSRKITALAGKRGKRPNLNVSVSTFVPKSHTPFMWFPQIALEEGRRRIGLIRNGLKGTRVRVKWNSPEMSWLEGIFSRGDRRLTPSIIEAWRRGARFDAWTEQFGMGLWVQAFKATGVNPQSYLHRQRSLEEPLPWNHIRSGVSKDFLAEEWIKAQIPEFTPDCRGKCLDCGVCDHKTVSPVLYRDIDFTPFSEEPAPQPAFPITTKCRLTFSKLESAKHLSHLELVRVFIRGLRRAGINLVHTKGYHPMPKLSFATALPVGTESLQETLDIEMNGTSNLSTIKARLNRELPNGIEVTLVEKLSSSRKMSGLKESHFLVTLKGLELRKRDLDKFHNANYFPVVKRSRKGEHEVDAKPLVKSLTLLSPNSVKLVLRNTSGPELRPTEIVKGIFALNDDSVSQMQTLKTRQVLM
ncbi:MAG: TIGR03960 family B12-binding radical SAM protein [Desulfobacteraceae bacterium]|nr:TIGR03960 family B12-binding radical SAM protein [Desulfobacteraceae bacterium]